jgi:hypothetical protein
MKEVWVCEAERRIATTTNQIAIGKGAFHTPHRDQFCRDRYRISCILVGGSATVLPATKVILFVWLTLKPPAPETTEVLA